MVRTCTAGRCRTASIISRALATPPGGTRTSSPAAADGTARTAFMTASADAVRRGCVDRNCTTTDASDCDPLPHCDEPIDMPPGEADRGLAPAWISRVSDAPSHAHCCCLAFSVAW